MKMERRYSLAILFVLSALALAMPLRAQVTLISTGAVWKYLDDGSDQGATWRAPGFDDATWASGPAELGFGDGGEATTNQSGHMTYYFRRHFNVVDASSITNLRALLKRDDGAVAYLNGTEVFRDNMAAGSLDFTSPAATTAADDGQNFFPHSFPATALVNGENILQVEVHQVTNTSSDISFDLELVGNPLPVISITTPTNGQTIAASAVSVSGTAIPGGTNITSIDIYQSNTVVATSTAASFTAVWQNVDPGSYTLRAKVTDNLGLVATSAPVSITVQTPPATLLIPRGSTWKYHNLNQDLGTIWTTTNYDDSAANGWAGPAAGPLGWNPDFPQYLATVINISPDNNASGNRYPTIYFRRAFNVSRASAYEGLILRIMADDAAGIYLNGQYLTNTPGTDATLPHTSFCCASSGAISGDPEHTYYDYRVPSNLLVDGVNVIAAEGRQQAASSSDLTFDLEVEGIIDLQPPIVINTDPTPGSTLLDLTYVTVTFDAAVTGVDASDLLINSEPATNLLVVSSREYQFNFPPPATGVVQIAWSPTHGIADTSPSHNAFDGSGTWTYTYNTNFTRTAQVIISEFMANNNSGIRDPLDGKRSDWIELYNAGAVQVDLAGWFLTDESTNLTKWRFPSVILQPNSYLLVWASGDTEPTRYLHTNFKLSSETNYLALVDLNTNIMSEFSPYPAQQPDISYGRDRVDASIVGYFTTPTPGAQNSPGGAGFMDDPVFSIDSGVFTNDSLSLTITGPVGGTIRYTTDGTVPTNTSTVYVGPISITQNTTVKARVYPNSGTLFPSRVVAKTYMLLDASVRDFNSNLPVLILDSRTAIPQNIPPDQSNLRSKGAFLVFDTQGGRSFLRRTPDFQGPAAFEQFGQTSAGFGKKPWNIETQDALGNDEEHSILGMPSDADWKLRNPWTDKFLMADFLAFEMFEQMGNYSVRRKFVEVFVHQGAGKLTAADYHGIEVFVEKIEQAGNRVDIAKLGSGVTNATDINISGGYMFKRDKDSTGDLNFSSTGGAGFGAQPLKLHEPKPKEVNNNINHPQVLWLRNYINTMESKLYAANWLTATGTNHWSYYLDPQAFADQFWIVEFPKQIDGYRLSDYYNKDRDRTNEFGVRIPGRIKPEPIWDWNLSFGNADYADGGHVAGWYYALGTDPTSHMWGHRLMHGAASNAGIGDPDFNQLIADRWGIFRTNVLNGSRVLKRIDELAALLTEAANRPGGLGDFSKFPRLGRYDWPNPNGAPNWDVDYVNPTTYQGIVNQMKIWVNGRYNWIDGLFLPPPDFVTPGGMVTNGTLVTMNVFPGATNYYTLDGTDPRASGGGLAPGAIRYTGPFTVNANAAIVARSRTTNSGSATMRPFQNTWSPPSSRNYYISLPGLRITEIMYHPLPPPLGNTNDADNFEYIEVKNISGMPLNVNRFQLSGGVQFDFPNVMLEPGTNAVIVANLAAFQSRYGTNNPNILVLGVYNGNLDNGGECIALSGPAREPIQEICFDDDWHPATDGHGFSLVINDPDGAPSDPSNWRPSSAINGSPGGTDPAPPSRPGVIISEVLTFGDPTPDTIELHNPTASGVNIGGWFLTDDFNNPKKFLIPNISIPARSFVTFTTNDFGVGPNGFALSSRGEEVYLFSGDAINLTGYAHGFDFGSAEAGVTFGRYVDSEGDDQYVAQASNTLGASNSLPKVGPVVISEIHYHPSDLLPNGTNGVDNTTDEYIELQNISGSTVSLFDPAAPTNTWHLREGVEYDFPATNVTIASGAFILVVGFNPVTETNVLESFRQRMGVPANVRIFGPWDGLLQNDNESVELRKPRTPETATNDAAYILVERIKYKDSAPWPPAADGLGMSLQRKVATAFGNDPTNWAAAGPTPGGSYVGGTPPTITSQPGNTAAQAGVTLTFNATASGTSPRFQWYFMGQPLAGATNQSLVLSNFNQQAHGGFYNILAYNGAGASFGTNFTVAIQLTITAHPQDINALQGTTNSFSVAAAGAGALRYQWYFNGNPVSSVTNPTATNSTLTLTNIQAVNNGSYFCVVSDAVGSLPSNPATLTMVAKPAVTFAPVSVTIVEGANATFTIAASNTAPMSFRWRTNGFTFPNAIINSGPTNSMITFTNVPLSFSNYAITCIITNIAGQSPTTPTARLFVLPDTDHDGLPDAWETATNSLGGPLHPGFDPNNPADGAADNDGDGMSNAAEYIAGTDYLDSSSYLKLQFMSNSLVNLQFSAVTNRSYTIQYKDDLSASAWSKLADVLQRNVNRTETIPDNGARTNRFYRLVIPLQP